MPLAELTGDLSWAGFWIFLGLAMIGWGLHNFGKGQG